jgi:predicted double-glycine peptidase
MRIRTSSRLRALAIGVLTAGALLAAPAMAGQVQVALGGGSLSVPVQSLAEARFSRVIKQKYDFSCGSAALATLLTYHYNRPTTEQEVFKAMFTHGDQEVIKKKGFSMLDMKNFLTTIGYNSNGYKIPLDKFAAAKVPAITLINVNGYQHFVVVKGVNGSDVLVGDPALGTRVLPRQQFEQISNGLYFVLLDDYDVGHKFFNDHEDWAVRAKAPLGTALMQDGLSTFALSIQRPGAGFF